MLETYYKKQDGNGHSNRYNCAMIYIDFQGGAHGNYLEFVCNKFLAKVTVNDLPFNNLGASHSKQYKSEKQFQSWHYSSFHGVKPVELFNSKIISIQIDHDDLLPLQSVSLLRAGDRNIDNDQLEIDTYHKLNNDDYKDALDNLIDSFFQTHLQDSYNAVKDSSWPDIACMDDFKRLPDWIQSECINQHNIRLLQFDADHPDCPRHILREFFKIGFCNPEQAGFIVEQKKMVYDSSNDLIIFPFASFYNIDAFINQIQLIGKWSNFELDNVSQLAELHNMFLDKQPYKDSKKFCDRLVTKICNQEIFELPKLDLLQESYISAQLENLYGCDLTRNQPNWFTNSRQILDFLVK
jgi:hypothetical protein